MAQYKVMWSDKYENFTYLGTVRQIVAGLEGEGFEVTVKRHFSNDDRVVYQTGKLDKFGTVEKSEKMRETLDRYMAWVKAHPDAVFRCLEEVQKKAAAELARRQHAESQRKDES